MNLSQYLKSSCDPMKLSDEDMKKLLSLDKEYGELVDMYRHDRNTKDVTNLDEECEKFLRARERGIKYFPYIKLDGENKFHTDGILLRLKNLLVEFERFPQCYLSKYYIELIYVLMPKFIYVNK